jgi:hypothetical protein
VARRALVSLHLLPLCGLLRTENTADKQPGSAGSDPIALLEQAESVESTSHPHPGPCRCNRPLSCALPARHAIPEQTGVHGIHVAAAVEIAGSVVRGLGVPT